MHLRGLFYSFYIFDGSIVLLLIELLLLLKNNEGSITLFFIYWLFFVARSSCLYIIKVWGWIVGNCFYTTSWQVKWSKEVSHERGRDEIWHGMQYQMVVF